MGSLQGGLPGVAKSECPNGCAAMSKLASRLRSFVSLWSLSPMGERNNPRVVNLVSFLQSYFTPIKRAADAANSDPLAYHSKAALLEFFWWLHLGAELEYFSRND